MSGLQQPDENRLAPVPQRILLVEDDELELELMADRLRSLGFETHTVSDGSAALELLLTQSFPLVITDWQMPRMDGIQLTERLRAQGDDETYIIMLTVMDDDSSHERGFLAGVDDYLSKRAPDAKIVAAIRAAFKTVEMRRALHAANGRQPNDTGTGVLMDRMRAEIKRAARYNRPLSCLVLQLDSESGETPADVMARAVELVANKIRADIDFVTRYRGSDGLQRMAVILPETPRTAAAQVAVRLCAFLEQALLTPLESCTARVGCAEFTPGEEMQPSAQSAEDMETLLREAEAAARVPPPPDAQPLRSEAG